MLFRNAKHCALACGLPISIAPMLDSCVRQGIRDHKCHMSSPIIPSFARAEAQCISAMQIMPLTEASKVYFIIECASIWFGGFASDDRCDVSLESM